MRYGTGRSAAEMNEMIEYRTVPKLAKATQQSSTTYWSEIEWVHHIESDGARTDERFSFKVT